MTAVGWLVQPAVFPWAAFVFGLCVGSFLNVVIHRLPKMLERGWRAECAELAGQPLDGRPVEVGEHQARALRRQPPGARGADASRRPGDEDDAPVEPPAH